jgi:glycosyltransferase involved in cell wall biosynthesis
VSKIVIDARESGTSTGRYVDKLIEYLAKAHSDFEFHIITKPHRLEFMKSIAPNLEITGVGIKEFTLAEQLAFIKILRALKPDLVHFSMVQQPVFYMGKVVTTIHDLIMTWEDNPSRNPVVHRTKQLVYKWVIKKAAKKSTILITPTKSVREDVIKFTNQAEGKITVTYESADKINDKAEPINKLVGKQFVMYIGRPMPHKNLEKLIDAFSLLKEQHPDLYLVLAGKVDPNYQRIAEVVKSKGIQNVFFTDFVSEGQLRWLYENCRAYVFPSLSEGFGLPGLEAMVHGAPVLSSNATCLPEVYGDAAKYFDPTNEKEMATAISSLIDDNELRNDLIKRGYVQAKKYSWQRMTEQTLDVYKRALS